MASADGHQGQGASRALSEGDEDAAKLLRQVFDQAMRILRGRRGVGQDLPKGMEMLKAAAQGGLAEAQSWLGYTYKNGKFGVVRDDKKSVKWYRRAADQGDAQAQVNLADCYQKGEGVDKDPVEAARFLRLSADRGLASAQNRLAICYFKGDGVPQDRVEAVRWFQLAVDQGNAVAQCCLAFCFHGGKGVKQDYVEAAKFYQLAADQDEKNAQAGLGMLYFEGHGVQRNCDRARYWLLRSRDTGQRVTNALAQIEKSASELLDKKTDTQRTMIEAGESVLGQTQDGAADHALHVAARELQPDAVALLFDHPSFDDLIVRKNTAGELARDVVSAGNPAKAQTREAWVLRSILSVSRRTRAACVLWCFEMLRISDPERLVACIPRDIVGEIVKHVLPPKSPGSLHCGVITLMNSPDAWREPCLARASPVFEQPTSPADVRAIQQQVQQVVVDLPFTVVQRALHQLQAVAQLQPLGHQQQQAPPSISAQATDDFSDQGTKRAREKTGPEIIDVDEKDEGELGEAGAAEPASKRARS